MMSGFVISFSISSTSSFFGGLPRSLPTISFAISMPESKIITDTARPIAPSNHLMPQMCVTLSAIIVARVARQSFRLSCFTVFRFMLSLILYSLLLKYAIHSLTKIEVPKTIMYTILKSSVSGCMIFSIELLASSNPITRISPDTARADMYSSLPWPNGCSLSTGLLASFVPAIVTEFDAISDKLFNASAVTEIEPERLPTINLNTDKIRLHIIPTMPLITP